ncbi:MAG: YIP1 family protein [Clostridia bacterium]|nr:YIP1 family protein [Clostridia bacterium]
MKSRLLKLAVIALSLVMIFGGITASAYDAYDTYTYSIDGLAMKSPAAYSASASMNSYDIGLVNEKYGNKVLTDASDIFADCDGNVYVADRGNNRIVVLNKYYSVTAVISDYVDEFGRAQTLSTPEGVYVTDPSKTSDGSSYIYVCDTGNSRIVIFDREYNYVRTITCPQSPLLNSTEFVPSAIAVDIYGRIFVVSLKAYQGIIVLSSDGDFTGYIGAQKVTYSVIQMIWRRFQTKEQREAQVQNISVSYNNITVDDDGFVYATSDKIDETKQLSAIQSKSPDYSPVKKLNSTGSQIMKRNGFFDPGGEVDVFYPKDVSKINDVALGAEGSWTILDYRHSKFFTYDQSGNLLFAFGDKGDQLGNGVELKGITYQVIDGVYYLLALDNTGSTGYKITVYSPTEYCDKIISALRNQNNHLYSASIDDWQEVLTRNNNFDLAYIGIGKALYSQGKYNEAQDALANAYETDYASKAFSEARKDVIGKWIIPIVIAAIVLLVVAVKFLAFAKKKNKATSLKVGRKTYLEELLYVFHLVFHPFDGFWDLKHEKRGSVRAATTFLVLTVLAFFYNSIGKGYLFNPRGTSMTIFMAILSVTLPVFLWAVSNWCLTTLFDGEGSFKDIYIATCYSLAPLALMLTVSTLLTNVLSGSEAMIVTLVTGIGIVWSLILIFFGMLVTHDYSLSKNFITTLGTIVAMLIIMFVAILFSSLLVKMVSFVTGLVSEIVNRL